MRIEPAIGFPDKPAIEALLAHARFISRRKQNCRALHIESERHSPFASRSAKPQFFHVRVARAGQGVNAGPSQLRSEPLKQPPITPESPSAHPSGNASNSWSNSSAIRTTQLTQIVCHIIHMVSIACQRLKLSRRVHWRSSRSRSGVASPVVFLPPRQAL